MIKDTLKSFKTSDNCVLLTGNACELTVSFEDFLEMVKELSKELLDRSVKTLRLRVGPAADSVTCSAS